MIVRASQTQSILVTSYTWKTNWTAENGSHLTIKFLGGGGRVFAMEIGVDSKFLKTACDVTRYMIM